VGKLGEEGKVAVRSVRKDVLKRADKVGWAQGRGWGWLELSCWGDGAGAGALLGRRGWRLSSLLLSRCWLSSAGAA
jgi:hypothetical protein